MLMIELRCPVNNSRMFGKMVGPVTVVPGNLMEFACRDCKVQAARSDSSVCQVLHRFDLAGELIETEVMRGDESSRR